MHFHGFAVSMFSCCHVLREEPERTQSSSDLLTDPHMNNIKSRNLSAAPHRPICMSVWQLLTPARRLLRPCTATKDQGRPPTPPTVSDTKLCSCTKRRRGSAAGAEHEDIHHLDPTHPGHVQPMKSIRTTDLRTPTTLTLHVHNPSAHLPVHRLCW